MGDQVHADDVPESTRVFMAERRDLREPPGDEVSDLQE
jgi:hypothetical protein